MKREPPAQTVSVSLPIAVVDALRKIQSALDDDTASALAASVGGAPGANKVASHPPSPAVADPMRGKYAAEFPGVPFSANTLPDVFARVVDMTAEVAPEVLDALAACQTGGGRRFVARERWDIHPGRRDLPTTRTESGWWISKNIGQEQLKHSLRALCKVCDLSFGADMKFPLWPVDRDWGRA